MRRKKGAVQGRGICTIDNGNREFTDKHFLSHYKTKKAEAKAAGTSTWEVLREKEEWLQRFGVAIAKQGQPHMIATARGY